MICVLFAKADQVFQFLKKIKIGKKGKNTGKVRNFVRPEKWETCYYVWHWCPFGYNEFFSELSKTHDDSYEMEEELSPTKLPKRKMDIYTLRQVIFG